MVIDWQAIDLQAAILIADSIMYSECTYGKVSWKERPRREREREKERSRLKTPQEDIHVLEAVQ